MRRFCGKIGGMLLAGVILCCAPEMAAQQVTTPSPLEIEQARALLQEKGISEKELRARMLQKGYDLDNIQESQVQEVQQVLLETVAELEAEKAAEAVQAGVDESIKDISTGAAGEIKEAVDKGASLDEAISEEIQKVETTDQRTPIYGHHLFRGKDVSVYRQSDNIKPPPTYILGPGDQLGVFINGPSQLDEVVTIDERGYVRFGASGPTPIALRGLTLRSAESILRNHLHRFYSFSDNQFELTVKSARTITVNMYGEVETVGSITLSAVNTLFNALVAAGGPTNIGTVRKIRLIRGDDVRVFDTYRFMSDPQIAEDFYLQQNDYVQIPVAASIDSRVVEISGAVRRPFKYELTGDEHLKKLIEYAGGVTDEAYLKDIQITRYRNDQRVVVNINLREIFNSDGDYLLQSGDQVVIQSVDEAIENFVEIRGAVVKPGSYERQEGMRISDLIALSTLDDEARTDFGYMLRYNPAGTFTYVRFIPEEAMANPQGPQNLELRDRDIVHIPSLVTYADDVSFEVRGAVRAPGQYQFDPAGILTVRDAILISGGLRQSAADFGYIRRTDASDPTSTQYLPFNANDAVASESSPENLVLMPYDSIYIFDRHDIEDKFMIRVSGAVRQPGEFPYDPNLTLVQALKLAGGLTFSAASNRIDVARVVINENQPTRITSYTATVDRELGFTSGDSSLQLIPFDHIIVRDVPEFELQRNVTLRGEVRFPGVYPIIENNERLANFIERAGGLSPEAFPGGAHLERHQDDIGTVVINMPEALDNPRSAANLVLREGDEIVIPKQQELVTITGAVNLQELYNAEFIERGSKVNVTFEEGKNARYYINEYAAGISENGRWRLVTVVHANGRVEKTTNLLAFKIYPKVTEGSTINVGRIPEKEILEKQESEPVDWGIVVRDSLAQATAILTLILLLERLN